MNMKKLVFIMIIASAVSCSAQTKIEDMKEFKEISWKEIEGNMIKMIGKDWMLITAGKPGDYNMMTASWGTLGWLWEKPVSTIYVRPQRYTHVFTEREGYYTITFYREEDREVLNKMGSVSGREFDKMNYDKLTPVETPNGSIAFKEAYLIIECKKLYATVLEESEFVDPEVVSEKYPQKDFHTMYVGEITGVWIKE
jgi:flavin reductase (DIM6/NTAB) family NADH-FMN oxidoreductase RutF